MKKLFTREQYLDTLRTQNYTKYTGIPKRNEANAGGFSNDVQWGDSWVGRLINSIARKAKIAVNLRRIDSLIKLLDAKFKELFETGKITCDNGVKKFLETKYLLQALVEKMESKEDLENLISEIALIITQVNSYNLENKEMLIKKLEEFRDYLNGLLKGGKSEPETPEPLESGDDYEISKALLQAVIDVCDLIKAQPALGPGQKYYILPVSNVALDAHKDDKKALSEGPESDLAKSASADLAVKDKYNGMIKKWQDENKGLVISDDVKKKFWQQAKSDGSNQVPNQNVSKESPNVDKAGIQGKVKKRIDVLKAQLKAYEDQKKNPAYKDQNYDVEIERLKKAIAGLEKKANEANTNSDFEFLYFLISEDADSKEPIKKEDTKKENIGVKIAWTKVVNTYKSSGIDKFVSQLKELLKSDSNKTDIVNICKQVKSTIKPMSYEQLIKEQISVSDASKAVASFGSVLAGYNDELISASGGASKPLSVFIESLAKLKKSEPQAQSEFKEGEKVQYKRDNGEMGDQEISRIDGDNIIFINKDGKEFTKNKSDVKKVDVKQLQPKESQPTKESFIKGFDRYRLIKETTQGVNYEDVVSKFNEIFTEEVVEMFNIDDKTKERIEKAGEEGDKYIITNADPIMEIVRLFNRAWRIHTPGRIPSGRSNGKVSSAVFAEYENLGEGSGGTPDEPGNGPYRNIELYEKWQEAVLAILGNSDYRATIFSDDAVFYFGGYDANGKYKEKVSKITIGKEYRLESRENEKTKPLGKVLVRFINNLLSDSQMYKKGAMPKFINEYFGISGETLESIGGLDFKGFDDSGKNGTVAEGIKGAVEVKFIKTTNSKQVKEAFGSKNSVVRLIAGDNSAAYLYLLTSDKSKYLYFYMFDQYNFDPTATKPPVKVGKQTYINFIRVDKSQLFQRGEFKYEKIVNFMAEDEKQKSGEAKFNIDHVELLVNKDGEVSYDSKVNPDWEYKYKMKEFIKNYNSRLL